MSRKTDLLATMAAVRPDRLDPPADPGRLERIRALAMSKPEPEPGRVPARAPRRRIRYGGTTVAAAALVAGLIVVARPTGQDTDPPSARRTLLAAATTLQEGDTAAGRYWTADLSTYTTASYLGDTAAKPPPPTAKPLYRFSSTCRARLWAARSGRDTSWLVVDAVTDRRLSGADERAWLRAGAPRPRTCEIHGMSVGLRAAPPAALALQRTMRTTRREEPTYPSAAGVPITLDQIAALPPDPTALKTALDELWLGSTASATEPKAGRTPPPDVTFQQITDLLVGAPAPPAVQAALYRVLAGLPIDRSHGIVTDRLGRHGVAFWTATGAMNIRLIIDPRTGRPLAVESRLAGELDGYTLVLRQGWTDTVPTLPAHRL
ncbi:hypothetical protein [Actinomadura violacea]|uniref:CU044_5270 family protein n=1 Tax=Actinomadura violacea TaxID=2819934 RepID=A0ABS3S300_9ACTN|nr:hypothetical protein [Actinomadura violacea]MBO2462654.1 hypothetical protein [Actinomadura violacea]